MRNSRVWIGWTGEFTIAPISGSNPPNRRQNPLTQSSCPYPYSDEPRLAPQLGRHPAQRVGNVGAGKRQQQHPHARRSTGLPLISLPAAKDFLCHRHHAVRLESEFILELLQRR